MIWNEVRTAYPDQWLVIEALEAHTTKDHQRQLDRLAVIEPCSDGKTAFASYRRYHQQYPQLQIELRSGLPFVHVSVAYRGAVAEISNVLLDTGSATSIFAADQVMKIDVFPAPEDVLYTIRGVGGTEVCFFTRSRFSSNRRAEINQLYDRSWWYGLRVRYSRNFRNGLLN